MMKGEERRGEQKKGKIVEKEKLLFDGMMISRQETDETGGATARGGVDEDMHSYS